MLSDGNPEKWALRVQDATKSPVMDGAIGSLGLLRTLWAVEGHRQPRAALSSSFSYFSQEKDERLPLAMESATNRSRGRVAAMEISVLSTIKGQSGLEPCAVPGPKLR